MAEYIRSIKVRAEVETNKRTEEFMVQAETFTEAVEKLAEFLNKLAFD